MSTQPTPEALRLAAELEGDYCPDWLYETGVDEIAAELRRLHALTQSTPATGGEPVAWWIPKAEQFALADKSGRPFVKAWEPLYASPQPVREPLTPEQIKDLRRNHPAEDTCGWSYELGLRDGERAHGITGGQHGTDA